MKLLKELSDLFRYFRKTKENEKEVVFYAEHGGYYPSFEGMIDQLLEKYQQPVCYITSDINDPVFQHPNPKLKAFYIDKLLAFFMVMIKCKVYVMTLTDLDRYHLKRSPNPVHYVYAFHSMVSTHMMYRLGAFDAYDSILCVGPHHTKEFRGHEKQRKLPAKILVEAGYYRLERIHAKYKKLRDEKKDSLPGKRLVLVAPSWGKENVIESRGKELVEVLLKNGYDVIVRPHPETVRRSPGVLEALESAFKGNSSFLLERSVATDDSLLKADVLISDCSGVALEYAFGTERPVIFLNVPYKIKNERYGELGMEPLELSLMSKIGVKVAPDKLDSLPDVMDRLIKEKQEFKDRIIRLRGENVFAFNRSAVIAASHIMETVKKGKKKEG